MTPLLVIAAASIAVLSANDYALIGNPQALPARAVTGDVAAELVRYVGDASVLLARDSGGHPFVLLIDRGSGVDHLITEPGKFTSYTDFAVCEEETGTVWLRIEGKGFVNLREKCVPHFTPRPVLPDDQGLDDDGPYLPSTEAQLTRAGVSCTGPTILASGAMAY